VIQIDARRNAIVVGPRSELLRDSLTASDLNWISVAAPTQALRAKAKLRSQHVAADATIVPLTADRVRVTFDAAQIGVAPGQVIAFYRDDIVLGAGMIEA
jgi:tRNA-specific 2-thiouridylase